LAQYFTELFADETAVAVEDIAEDEELFSIAHSSMLTTHNSNLQKIKPAILECLDAWNSLVLVMIYEDGLGEKSTWWPYLEILPREFDTLIYWSSEELAELQGSAVLDKIGKSGADVSFKKCLLPLVQQNAETFGRHAQAFAGADAETALLQLAHRMATLIMAYGFDLETESSSSEEEVEDEADGSSQSVYALNKGMVPLADLFNADGDLNNVGSHEYQRSASDLTAAGTPFAPRRFNDDDRSQEY
jgi:SET domain-containing protein 6